MKGIWVKFFFEVNICLTSFLHMICVSRIYVILHVGAHERKGHLRHYVADAQCVILKKINRHLFKNNLVLQHFYRVLF